jgi:serine phosphatase RsbU (regulator of sigma subunit)
MKARRSAASDWGRDRLVTAPPPKRRLLAGLPISVKLILATSVVVAAVLAIATWYGTRTIDELAQAQVAERRASGEATIVRESDLIATSVANASALPLANSQVAEIADVLAAALRDDAARGERRVQWLVVTDAAGTMFAEGRTADAPFAEQLADLEKLLAATAGTTPVRHARIRPGAPDWIYGTDIRFANGVIGKLRMGVSTAGLEQALTAQLDAAAAQAASARNKILVVSLALLVVAVLIALFQGIGLARPIRALTAQAQHIASGNFLDRVRATRRDELGTLAHQFNFMAERIKALLVEQARKASLEREMDLARMVQQAMLPPTALDTHGNLKVVGYCAPASSCGGDWWTYRKLSDGRLLVVVGDATGHGIHSAMIAATARGGVEALSSIDERLLTPDGVLRAIDSAIRDVGDHNVLMTCFAAVFDSSTGILHYANAGQNFPYVMKLGPTRQIEQPSIIAASGNPLGDRNIKLEIRRGSLQLRPGDVFVLFTDGLVERANRAGKLFGDRRLRNAMQGAVVADGPALVGLRDHVLAAVEQFADGVGAEDDITFVLCQYDPPAAARRHAGAAS